MWTYDHLSWRHLRDKPWFAAVPMLAAAAAVAGRIRLGPLVATPNFRHPVPFAKEVITLDARMTPGCQQQPRPHSPSPPVSRSASSSRGPAPGRTSLGR